jgi:hypothetical protein
MLALALDFPQAFLLVSLLEPGWLLEMGLGHSRRRGGWSRPLVQIERFANNTFTFEVAAGYQGSREK